MVVTSLQSMPSRQDSSPLDPVLETTTRYLVLEECTLSNLTAWKQKQRVNPGKNHLYIYKM